MNVRLETAEVWAPPSRWWWAVLAVLIAVGILLSWGVAFALLALIFLQMARPLDFVPIFFAVVAGGAAVFNEANMTAQLTRLTTALALMMVFYLLHTGRRAISVPRVGLTKPLLLFLGLSILNAGRGMLTGQPGKNVAAASPQP